jgi:hypothetical protein
MPELLQLPGAAKKVHRRPRNHVANADVVGILAYHEARVLTFSRRRTEDDWKPLLAFLIRPYFGLALAQSGF